LGDIVDVIIGIELTLNTNELFGGHYEPKSERDRELAEELYEILNRHKTNPLPTDN
jgi:hypothetical protein